MGVNLHIYTETEEKLTLEKGLALLNYLIENGCVIQKDRGYWDIKKERWIPSALNKAIKKYLDKETYTFNLIYNTIEFILSIKYNKNEIFFSVDYFFINQDKVNSMKDIELLKKLIGKKIKIKSIKQDND